MLAYAANAPRRAERRSSPNAMLAIIAVHVAVLAAVMSAKMDLPGHLRPPPIIVDTIPEPVPPPPDPSTSHPTRPQPGPTVLKPTSELPLPLRGPTFPSGPPTTDSGPTFDPGPVTIPEPNPNPTPVGVSTGPRLLTPASELKPPYPQSKLLAEEEASLRLRLSIDNEGRVVAVDPVGPADSVFLAAARKYLIAHWRYKPALDRGEAIASTLVITLRFQLDA